MLLPSVLEHLPAKCSKCFLNNVNLAVAPICLPKPFLHFEGEVAVAAGWGMTQPRHLSPHQSDTLQFVELRVSETRRKQSKMFGTKTRKEVSVDGEEEITDPCSGDSGGPLMYQDPSDKRYLLIGDLLVLIKH